MTHVEIKYFELKEDSMLLHYVAKVLESELDRPQIAQSIRVIADKLEILAVTIKER